MDWNLLFITADQWRGSALSCLDHPVVKTPNLDRLAAAGTLFQRHYANAVPCSPSRTSLHTGTYLFRHRVCSNGTPLDARWRNWAQVLRREGHDPVLFGYTDTPVDPRLVEVGDRRLTSYEEVLDGLKPIVNLRTRPEPWADWLAERGRSVPDDSFELYTTKVPGPEWEEGGAHPAALAVPAELHDTYFLTEQAISYLRNRRGRPFHLHLSYLRPHPPFIAPEPYNRLYDPARLPAPRRAATPAEEGAQHPWLAEALARHGAPEDERRLRRLAASYYGLMTEVDDNLGRLFAVLEELGLWERTLVVFTSDHGEQLGDHWLMGKLGYFDESYHVPLILRAPGGPAGQRVAAFTEHVDIVPTLLEALGAERPRQCDGASLLPFLGAEPPEAWRKAAHWEYDFRDLVDPGLGQALGLSPHQSSLNVLRGGRYKYVHFTALPPLLFDLARDPGETRNLAADPAHGAVVAAMAQGLLSWRMNHDERELTESLLTEDGLIHRPAPLRGPGWPGWQPPEDWLAEAEETSAGSLSRIA